jgi:putative CocE/NonD family hydrolase
MFIKPNARLHGTQLAGWKPKSLTGERYSDIILDHDVGIPMPDGTILRADVYRPRTQDKVPALIAWAPYYKDLQNARVADEGGVVAYLASRGYAHVRIQNRGSGKSGGTHPPMFSPQEVDDVCEAIEWTASQPWCDGSIGMIGASYLAMIQYFAAARKPPPLKAIFPFLASTDLYRDATKEGSVFNEFDTLIIFPMSSKMGMGPPALRHLLGYVLDSSLSSKLAYNHKALSAVGRLCGARYRPDETSCREYVDYIFDQIYDGPFYKERSAWSLLKDIDIPVLIGINYTAIGFHYRGAFEAWHLLDTEKKLFIGPTAKVYIPWTEYQEELIAWYDYALKGIDNGYSELPPVRYWLNGADEWRSAQDWPLPETEKRRFYLASKSGDVFDKHLLLSEEPGKESELSYLAIPQHMVYIKEIERYETQVLSYIGETFDEATEVVGPVKLRLLLSSNAIDTHVMVRVSDVAPDGSSRNLSWGWLRAAFRRIDEERTTPSEIIHDCTAPQALTPEEPVVLEFTCTPMANLFKRGHRLMLEVGARPDLLAPEKEDEIAFFNWHAPPYPARNRIYHGGEEPSYIEVEVL